MSAPTRENGWRMLRKGDWIRCVDPYWKNGVGPWVIGTEGRGSFGEKYDPKIHQPHRRITKERKAR